MDSMHANQSVGREGRVVKEWVVKLESFSSQANGKYLQDYIQFYIILNKFAQTAFVDDTDNYWAKSFLIFYF